MTRSPRSVVHNLWSSWSTIFAAKEPSRLLFQKPFCDALDSSRRAWVVLTRAFTRHKKASHLAGDGSEPVSSTTAKEPSRLLCGSVEDVVCFLKPRDNAQKTGHVAKSNDVATEVQSAKVLSTKY